MSEFLSVSHLTKRFGSLVAVDQVSFDVAEGEIFGIAGPNGAGKTTLFNLITGIPFAADSGKVTFLGRSIEKSRPDQIFRHGIARTFQKETTFDTLTVEQNVRVGAVYGGTHRRESYGRAVDEVLEKLELEEIRHQTARDLPLYDKKRLMIASAIVSDPKVLMLDEPAAGLNAVELAQLEKLILSLRDMGITIIIIEHVLPLLFGISTRIMVMDFGKKLTEGSPEKLARDEQVIEAYLGKRGKEVYRALTG